jgi:8-oxo-dGTP pyrophosphatase MutT (NUDIX family)
VTSRLPGTVEPVPATFSCRRRSPNRPTAGLDEARAQLLEASLVGAEQARLREQVVAFVDAHPDALHRSCRDGHLTGSAVVVDRTAPRFLLLHHRKLGRWLQPGGHADGDGDLADVALREAEEETGLGDLEVVTPAIDLDVHAIPARGDEPRHLHLDLRFLVLAGSDAEPVVNHESNAVRWVATSELDRYAVHGELRRLVLRGLEVAQRI